MDASITADDVINVAEAAGDITITGSVGGDVSDGDTVTLTVNGNNYTGTVTGNAFSIDVTGSDLVADGDLSIEASISHSDTAGNTGTGTDTESYTVDTDASVASAVTGISTDSGVTDGITNDNTLVITGTAEADSSVEVFIDGSSIGTATADGSGSWSFDHSATVLTDGNYALTAQATDTAGNTGVASAAFAITVDTGNPAPTITLDASITADDVINATEAATNISITGSVGGEVSDGDTVTLTVNDNLEKSI